MTSISFGQHSEALQQSVQGIRKGEPSLAWAVYDYDKGGKELRVACSGAESELEEFVEELGDDGKMQYGFLRLLDPSTTPSTASASQRVYKFVLITYCGDGVPVSRKGLFHSHVESVLSYFRGYHVHIQARCPDDITLSHIIKRVKDSSGAKYTRTEETSPPANPPPLTKPQAQTQQPPKPNIVQYSYSNYLPKSEAVPTQPKPKFTPSPSTSLSSPKSVPSTAPFKVASSTSSFVPQNKKVDVISAKFSTLNTNSSVPEKRVEAVVPPVVKRDPDPPVTSASTAVISQQQQPQPQQQSNYSSGFVMPKVISVNLNQISDRPKFTAVKTVTTKPTPSVVAPKIQSPPAAQRIVKCSPSSEPSTSPVVSGFAQARAAAVAFSQSQVSSSPSNTTSWHTARSDSDMAQKPNPIPEIQKIAIAASPEKAPIEVMASASPVRVPVTISEPTKSPQHSQDLGLTAKAVYDYEASEGNEIDLHEGELITNIIKEHGEWWHGKNSAGNSGYFPSNYVDSFHPEAQEVDIPEPVVTDAGGRRAIALYDYDAAEVNEISFKEGDVISDIEFTSEDWWSGIVNGTFGVFPGNYVELQN